MREIFSVRFFAAVGGVVALFFLLTTIFATREVIEGGESGGDAVELHRIDFVEHIAAVSNPQFALDIDGVAANDTVVFIDESRSLQIVADTPGVNHCPRFPAAGACAIAADLLGEGVVWFAIVPAGTNRTVDLPAIDTLDDGIATLVNGWQVPFAPVLDRRCDDDYSSYREFRNLLGDDFTSIYGVEDRRLVAVRCGTRVAYAPEPAEASTLLTVPPPTGEIADNDDVVESIGAALVGRSLDDAIALADTAGWTVRTDDLDDPSQTFTADAQPDRLTLSHRDGIVERVTVG